MDQPGVICHNLDERLARIYIVRKDLDILVCALSFGNVVCD